MRSADVDPAAFIRKYGRKVTSIHLKYWKPRQGSQLFFPSLGQGDLNLPDILRASREVGVKHYIIEDESGKPDEQIAQSLRHLEGLK